MKKIEFKSIAGATLFVPISSIVCLYSCNGYFISLINGDEIEVVEKTFKKILKEIYND